MESPVHCGGSDGKIEIVKYLLQNGANINDAKDLGGWSPLRQAAYFGKLHIVKLLHQNGAEINAKTCCLRGKHLTLLDFALFRRHHHKHLVCDHHDIAEYLKKAEDNQN